ncbi:hypothetical protein N8D56_20645 [Devosia sp. A8/3-2]|nr:hypothetical protein N8D56_20645 [Devosia sp. A8/3-2]
MTSISIGMAMVSERHDQRGDQDGQHHFLALEFEEGKGEGGHRADEQRADHGNYGDEDRIEDEQGHRRTAEGGRVIVEG